MEKVFSTRRGSGQPLVLVHGFCEDTRIWETIAPQLASFCEVVCVDLPGFGQTPLAENANPETIEDMADRLAHKLRAEGLEKSIVIGHSLGGYVTLALAERHPELLSGFGLFHSTAYADTDEKKQNRLKQADFVTNNGVVPFVEVLIPGLFAKSQPHDELLVQSLAIAKECSPQGIINALLAMRLRRERLDVLQNAKIPVLVIAGAEDALIPAEVSSYQASLVERCQFTLFEKSGHMGQLEEPLKSIATIKQFVEFCVIAK